MFGKSFEELEPHDRIRVGGKVGQLAQTAAANASIIDMLNSVTTV